MMSRRFTGFVKYKDFSSKDIRSYARKHGYSYVKSQDADEAESGYYMAPTYYNVKMDRVSWSNDGVEFEFYTRLMNYELFEKVADKAEDKKRSRLILGLVFSAKLPYKLPSVFVQSLTSKTIWNILGITGVFLGKKVKLEGDFNKFFNVYTPSGEASNAFLALAPNTMIKILRAGSGLDFQFAGDRIYFFYDVRLKGRNVKNLWGLMGDMETISLDKKIAINQISQSEWLEVIERSKEYSADILKAFYALKRKDEERKLFYLAMTGKKIGVIAFLQMVVFCSLIVAAYFVPALLLLAVPIGLWSFIRYATWSWRRKRLLRDWDKGIVKNIVR